MFDSIGETAIRNVPRPESGLAASEKVASIEKKDRLRADRPIEKSGTGNKSEMSTQQQEPSSKYKIEDKRLVFEKYDKNGQLILSIPPKYSPIDENA
ncbi:MAG: hypothetical protein HKM93_09400 [Desulfobacteraceae bacterium]|nr:hypothetical protein [Desulfobacteraceae bacterium]